MNSIQILDCTLRDGGYCNQWKFGYENIKKIIRSLIEANIDIVECGFLTDRVQYDDNIAKFTSIKELNPFIREGNGNKQFVAMMNYGEYDVKNLTEKGENMLDGVRVAFHKKDMQEAMKLCEKIKQKGYQVFVQPMVSVSYSDEEFLQMIKLVNEFRPYAFYIVDSFGMMKEKELIRLFYMVEHNLDNSIRIGFHSHNNMQLAYSNAQKLVTVHTDRNLIIDTSVYGMGRGAGNLNTELFVEFLNESIGSAYEMKPLLSIIDEIINEFYQQNYWGYSLPNYLSAKHNAHPNYAKYLDDQKTLTVEDMESIFEMMDAEKCVHFDREYIKNLYIRYMNRETVQDEHKAELKKALDGKRVLLIAPGKSSTDEREKIKRKLLEDDVIGVSVNFEYSYAETDYIFLSNLRRFRELNSDRYDKCIVTSNISAAHVYYQTNYNDLLNNEEAVKDKAGLMVIRFLMEYDVKEIMLAGFDGYSHDMEENYGENKMAFYTRNAVLDAMNVGMSNVIRKYAEIMKISFLTKPRYITV